MMVYFIEQHDMLESYFNKNIRNLLAVLEYVVFKVDQQAHQAALMAQEVHGGMLGIPVQCYMEKSTNCLHSSNYISTKTNIKVRGTAIAVISARLTGNQIASSGAICGQILK